MYVLNIVYKHPTDLCKCEPLTYDVNVGHVAPPVRIIAALSLGDGQELDADVRATRLGRDHAVEGGADAYAELVALVVVDAHAAHQPLQRVDADVDGAAQSCTQPRINTSSLATL